MKNEHVLEILDDYVDSGLDAETLRMVESHLAECPSCRKEAEALKRLTSDLRNLPLEIEPPAGITLPELPDRSSSVRRIFTFRRNGKESRDRVPEGRGSLIRFPSPAFVGRAAAILAIALCGTLAWYVFKPESSVLPGNGGAQPAGSSTVETANLKPAEVDVPENKPGERATDLAAAKPAAGGIAKPATGGAVNPATGGAAKPATPEPGPVSKPAPAPETARAPESSPDPARAATATVASPRSAGTGSVSGTVRDESSGEPLFGVNVILLGTTRGATTDPDGMFRILGVPEGRYDVRATAIGYEMTELNDVAVTADNTTGVEFRVRPSAVDLQAVAITADQAQGKSGAPPEGTSAPSKEAIESIPNVRSAEDVLKLRSATAPQGNNLYLRGAQTGDVRSADGEIPGTESYDRIHERGFRDASVHPKSTFSIDVDAASYSNIRRFLDDGRMPPADAVRIEEMLNYFTYDYPRPERGRPFSVTTQTAECPWNPGRLLMMVGLKGREIDARNLPPGNLVFLIDVSGSMRSADKLPLLKSAFRILVDQLRARDRVSIVVYAGNAGLVLPPTPGDEKETILDAIDALAAGGSTAGGAGIRLAYDQAREAFIEGGNNRVILATDGDFNVGVSSDEEMVRLIERQRDDGIFLSVLGFGTGNLKDSKMEKIADKGNGAYYYIDNMKEARKVFGRQLAGTLYTIAKDVKIQVEFDPEAVSSYRLIGYENRVLNNRDFRDDRKDAGELGAGHSVTALYEIVPVGMERDDDEEVARLDPPVRRRPGRDGSDREDLGSVSLRYKEPDASASTEMRYAIRNERSAIEDAPENLRFAAAVAEFGMMLRDSEYRGTASFRQVLRLAGGALGHDPGGYRAEFIRLVEKFERIVEGD